MLLFLSKIKIHVWCECIMYLSELYRWWATRAQSHLRSMRTRIFMWIYTYVVCLYVDICVQCSGVSRTARCLACVRVSVQMCTHNSCATETVNFDGAEDTMSAIKRMSNSEWSNFGCAQANKRAGKPVSQPTSQPASKQENDCCSLLRVPVYVCECASLQKPHLNWSFHRCCCSYSKLACKQLVA